MASCNSNQQKLCGRLECNVCFERSFASYTGKTVNGTKVDCWSDENNENPWNVRKHSGKTYKFNCDSCPHSFPIVLSNITNLNEWHDSKILSVIELPEKDRLIFNVEYPVDWE